MSVLSRTRVRDLVKRGDPTALSHAARRARERSGQFPDYFGDDVLLVPVPRHAPTHGGALWPAKMIAESMVDEGLARHCQPLLQRSTAVDKSAMWSGPRTVRRHLQTITAEPPIDYPQRIVVVDDVVTSGSTLFATTQLARAACPNADVKAFALLRTLSGQEVPETPDQCLAPCTGTISLKSDDTTIREP